MSISDEEFLKELLEDFRIEATEHLQIISDGLLMLEKSVDSGGDASKIEEVFRVIHSMKGAARAVNLLRLEQLAMVMEGVFHEIKNNKLRLRAQMFDVLYPAADMLQLLVKESDQDGKSVSANEFNLMLGRVKALSNPAKIVVQEEATAAPPEIKSEAASVVADSSEKEAKSTKPDLSPETSGTSAEAVSAAVQEEVGREIPPPRNKTTTGALPQEASTVQQSGLAPENETIRVPVTRLVELLNLAEEMITSKNVLRYQAVALAEQALFLAGVRAKLEENYTEIRDDATPMVQELRTSDSRIAQLAREMDTLQRRAARSIDELIENVRETLLQPFSVVFAVVPRLVRDLSKSTGKQVNVRLEGAETELDRRILEQLKDPLIHLIRNCIDHGIEAPEVRRAAGKPDEGTLSVRISKADDRKISILIEDDGAGIQKQRVLDAARKSGIMSPEALQKLTDSEVNRLIFASGVTTSSIITDVSGRGLGMAIVLEKVTQMGGMIEVESEAGKGSRFSIRLPQTLATFHGILLEADGQLFLMPAQSVSRAIRVSTSEVKTVESKSVVTIDGETVALVKLAAVLGLKGMQRKTEGQFITGLMLYQGGRKMVFATDAIYAEHEGIVKPLGKLLRRVKHIEGACFLGDGRIVPVLKPSALFETAAQMGQHLLKTQGVAQEKTEQKIRVLAADDSITIRNVMRNYLEMAGCEVTTAFDGQDAFEKLLEQTYDLVVTDVEMPRMNGFELTARIRKQSGLQDLPVIVVTALETPEDRNRGMEAGANAYIVKSNFQQSNLIDTIKRLV